MMRYLAGTDAGDFLNIGFAPKGQEWKSVFVLNVVDGCMPSDLGAGTSAELEEERRLQRLCSPSKSHPAILVVGQFDAGVADESGQKRHGTH